MSDIFRKISEKIKSLGSGRQMVRDPSDRRRAPRFICSAPVIWEVGREQGEAQLREVSATGLRLRVNRAFVAGKHIRVRPKGEADAPPLTTDVAIGTIVYSKPRSGGFEVGVELINPDRISRFAWIGQLSKLEPAETTLPKAVPTESSRLRLVRGSQKGDEKESLERGLVREEYLWSEQEKNSKK